MFGGHFAFGEVAFTDLKMFSREAWRSIFPTEEETSLTPRPRRAAALSPAEDETWSTISPSGDETWSSISPSGDETWSSISPSGDETWATISPSGDETWTDVGPRIT